MGTILRHGTALPCFKVFVTGICQTPSKSIELCFTRPLYPSSSIHPSVIISSNWTVPHTAFHTSHKWVPNDPVLIKMSYFPIEYSQTHLVAIEFIERWIDLQSSELVLTPSPPRCKTIDTCSWRNSEYCSRIFFLNNRARLRLDLACSKGWTKLRCVYQN